METIINIKTYRCECGYAIDREPIVSLCPSCKKSNLSIDSNKSKVTIMSKEELDDEIKAKKEQYKKIKNKDDDDLSTPQKEKEYKDKRKKEIDTVIEEMKKLE